MAEPDPELGRTETTNSEGNEPVGSWLTYATAAERFGLSADAVRMRAKRLGWRTQPGNDGRTLVWIEGTAPEPAPEQQERLSEQGEQPGAGLLPQAVAALESAVTLLGEQLAGAAARAGAERECAEAEQKRANRLVERLDAAKVEAEKAETLVADLKAELVAKDGRVTEAEAAAEHARGVAREAVQAAETLKAAVHELKAGQTTHAQELAAAQEAARLAEEQAEALRQAEDARKARGRLRRAWDGWRGR